MAKIYFVVTDTSEANAIASLDRVELQIGREWLNVETIKPLLKDIVAAKLTATSFAVWINYPGKIQGVRYTNALPVYRRS